MSSRSRETASRTTWPDTTLSASLDCIMCRVYRRQESGGTTVPEEIATIRQAQMAMRSYSAASMREKASQELSLPSAIGVIRSAVL